MKTFKFSVLCAAALSLCAAASAQVTDYTPFSANLTANYVVGNVPFATAINNATLLKKIGFYLGFSPVGTKLAIDNTTGDLCVLTSAGALRVNLTTGIGGTNVVTDVNGVSFKVVATTFFSAGNAVEITSGTSTLPTLPAANFNVKGSLILPGFTIRFQDDFNNPGVFGDDYVLTIDTGLGTFANSLTVTGLVDAYKQSLSATVYGFVTDFNGDVGEIGGETATITGTLTASGTSAVAAPSIWDVITPVGP